MPHPHSRTVRPNRNGRHQIVSIPMEFELPGNEATLSREGNRLVIEPVHKPALASILNSLDPLDEEFPEIFDPPIAPENIF